MSTFAVTMVKDEADVIGQSVQRMLGEVDAMIVADNGSTDGTREILHQMHAADPRRLSVIDDPEVGYFQSRKMSALAAEAAERGASWVVPFDADERWTSPHGRIADVLAGVDSCVAVAPAPILNYVASSGDDQELPPFERITWRRREALGLPKVACRAALPVTIAQGNHGASYGAELMHGLLEVHHFPYRSPEQFLSKVRNGAAAYKATDLPADVGSHWRQYGDLLEQHGPDAVEDWFRQHFLAQDPGGDPDLICSPCP